MRERARLTKQMASVVKENKNSLSHFSYTCPGLHGPGTKTDVTMVTFDAIFGPAAPPILIPLFQRTYCWEDQIEGWWRRPLRRNGNRTPSRKDHLQGHGKGDQQSHGLHRWAAESHHSTTLFVQLAGCCTIFEENKLPVLLWNFPPPFLKASTLFFAL